MAEKGQNEYVAKKYLEIANSIDLSISAFKDYKAHLEFKFSDNEDIVNPIITTIDEFRKQSTALKVLAGQLLIKLDNKDEQKDE